MYFRDIYKVFKKGLNMNEQSIQKQYNQIVNLLEDKRRS